MDEQADREHMETDASAMPDALPHEPTLTEPMSTEVAPGPAARSASSKIVIGVCLVVLAVLQGLGSFNVWLIYSAQGQSYPYKGIVNWRGFGWMVLVLAIVIIVVIVADLVQPTVALKAVTATLFGTSGLVATYFVVQYTAFPQGGQPTASVGWGLGLCLGVGVVGLVLGTLWAMLARPSRPALA